MRWNINERIVLTSPPNAGVEGFSKVFELDQHEDTVAVTLFVISVSNPLTALIVLLEESNDGQNWQKVFEQILGSLEVGGYGEIVRGIAGRRYRVHYGFGTVIPDTEATCVLRAVAETSSGQN